MLRILPNVYALALSEDIDLMVRLTRRDDGGAADRLRARRSSLDRFIEFAVEHGLAVLLLGALEASPLRAHFSADQLARLVERRQIQAARSQRLLAALDELADHFNAAGQRFLLLKGPYLAARFYGDAAAREFVDLDLLVPSRERERAFAILAAAGYARRSKTLLSHRLTCFFVHGLDFVKGQVPIDLHFCLTRHPSFRIDEQAMWNRAPIYRLHGREYTVLPDEYEIVLALLSLLRDLERGRPKLKNILELLRMLETFDAEFDWSRFFAARQAEETLRPTVNLLGLVLDLGGTAANLPALRAALSGYSDRRVPTLRGGPSALFASHPYGLKNKLWCARLYESSPASWLAWWTISLPFRSAVHARPPRRSTPSIRTTGLAH